MRELDLRRRVRRARRRGDAGRLAPRRRGVAGSIPVGESGVAARDERHALALPRAQQLQEPPAVDGPRDADLLEVPLVLYVPQHRAVELFVLHDGEDL